MVWVKVSQSFVPAVLSDRSWAKAVKVGKV